METSLIMKKRFFFSESQVTQDDPVQLHMVYSQVKEELVDGKHIFNHRDDAFTMAALILQVLNGNYLPDVHKSNTINLKQCLPPSMQLKDAVSRVTAEWKKISGLTELQAKFRFIQFARSSLKTYGMTIFKVKDRMEGQRKLADSILALTQKAIIRMDIASGNEIKQYPFTHLNRWAVSQESLTLDFGAYEKDYVVLVTKEGEFIAEVIAGYINLMMKDRKLDTKLDNNKSDAPTRNCGACNYGCQNEWKYCPMCATTLPPPPPPVSVQTTTPPTQRYTPVPLNNPNPKQLAQPQQDHQYGSLQNDNQYGSMQVPDNQYGSMQMPDSQYGSMQYSDNQYGSMQMPDNQYGSMQMPDNQYGNIGTPKTAPTYQTVKGFQKK